MCIHVASQNPVKLEAVNEVTSRYEELFEDDIMSVEIDSGVSKQPVSLEETFAGAQNRARSAFDDECRFSFGLESGLIESADAESGYGVGCVCAIYDGKSMYLGRSPVFILPKNVVDPILNDGLDLNQAAVKCGFTTEERIGYSEGIVYILSQGEVKRGDFLKQAVQEAVEKLRDSRNQP